MGPLTSSSQLSDVLGGIERLSGVAKKVHGDGGRGSLVGIDNERGYFVSPVVFQAVDSRKASAVHEHEVFGPVATILPYDGSAADAAGIVKMGQGGLVSTVYSDDRDFVRDAVLGIAPYHGRVCVGSARMAEHSMGPGTVLPQMVHGGPGRAGGGEELGGRRGLEFYMQRTAVQGLKPLLEKTLG